MNTDDHTPPEDLPESQMPMQEKTHALLRLLPSTGRGAIERRANIQPHTEKEDEKVNLHSLTEAECEERLRQILRVIAQVETATQHHWSATERIEFAQWLAWLPHSLRTIREAGESVSVMQTYGRPFAREYWFKAFAQPLIHPKRIRELCRQAYEKGRKEGEAKEEKTPSQSGMDGLTKRLLEAEKELMNLREERTQLKAQISQLEREVRAAQRKGEAATAESADPVPRFYRLGDYLIVEHFRRNGQVYYHEQGVEESNIPATRSRQMPAADFDRQIVEKQPSILTDSEIAQLPGYGHWRQ